MKRLISIILILVACVSLCACTYADDKSETSGQNGDANTPYVGENGNWWIGDADTGIKAEGVESQNGAYYKVISDTMTRYNCKDDNGYDKSVTESNAQWVLRHDGIELGNLELYGCEKSDNGYRVVNTDAFGIKYRVKQNLGALVSRNGTKNGAESLWVNRDNCSTVLDTDIRSEVGVGAFFVKLKYTDGVVKTFSKTNFFEGAEKGVALDILTKNNVDTDKTIESIEITLVYEMYSGGPGLINIWWWHEYTNWRCEYTYNF